MSAILDRGSLLFATGSVLGVSLLLRGVGPFPVYAPLLVLAVFYVPGLLLMSKLLAAFGTSGADFQRDYSPLLTCTATAWTAANLPLVAIRWLAPATAFWPLAAIANLWFLALVFFAVRTVFGSGNGHSALLTALSWIPLVAAGFLWGPLQFILGWLASPFFLFFAWYYLGGELGNLGEGLRRRQTFHRMLEAAAVNPHDAEAQYQLGLIYAQRRQMSEATKRFDNAIAIDPNETGAHFELGRIAREQGRLNDALIHFQKVVDQDPVYRQSEILRELGAVYLAARQYADAYNELVVYAERRPYDPEGLYYYGRSLEGLGRTAEARDVYNRAVEAVRTAPRYRMRQIARWSRMAQRQMRKFTLQ